MNIQGFFSAAYATTADAASSVFGFSKNIFNKSFSTCTSLVGKVKDVAGRFIPSSISHVAKTNPGIFYFVTGTVVAGGVLLVASRFFSNSKNTGNITNTEKQKNTENLTPSETLVPPADTEETG